MQKKNTPGAAPSFADKLQQLLRRREEQKPLPDGFIRCPMNPSHQIPAAALVTHLEQLHSGDPLAMVPDAMYSMESGERRERYLREELYASWRRTLHPGGTDVARDPYEPSRSSSSRHRHGHRHSRRGRRRVSRSSHHHLRDVTTSLQRKRSREPVREEDRGQGKEKEGMMGSSSSSPVISRHHLSAYHHDNPETSPTSNRRRSSSRSSSSSYSYSYDDEYDDDDGSSSCSAQDHSWTSSSTDRSVSSSTWYSSDVSSLGKPVGGGETGREDHAHDQANDDAKEDDGDEMYDPSAGTLPKNRPCSNYAQGQGRVYDQRSRRWRYRGKKCRGYGPPPQDHGERGGEHQRVSTDERVMKENLSDEAGGEAMAEGREGERKRKQRRKRNRESRSGSRTRISSGSVSSIKANPHGGNEIQNPDSSAAAGLHDAHYSPPVTGMRAVGNGGAGGVLGSAMEPPSRMWPAGGSHPSPVAGCTTAPFIPPPPQPLSPSSHHQHYHHHYHPPSSYLYHTTTTTTTTAAPPPGFALPERGYRAYKPPPAGAWEWDDVTGIPPPPPSSAPPPLWLPSAPPHPLLSAYAAPPPPPPLYTMPYPIASSSLPLSGVENGRSDPTMGQQQLSSSVPPPHSSSSALYASTGSPPPPPSSSFFSAVPFFPPPPPQQQSSVLGARPMAAGQPSLAEPVEGLQQCVVLQRKAAKSGGGECPGSTSEAGAAGVGPQLLLRVLHVLLGVPLAAPDHSVVGAEKGSKDAAACPTGNAPHDAETTRTEAADPAAAMKTVVKEEGTTMGDDLPPAESTPSSSSRRRTTDSAVRPQRETSPFHPVPHNGSEEQKESALVAKAEASPPRDSSMKNSSSNPSCPSSAEAEAETPPHGMLGSLKIHSLALAQRMQEMLVDGMVVGPRVVLLFRSDAQRQEALRRLISPDGRALLMFFSFVKGE